MVRTPNPYRPGFNQPPGVLAGRDDVLGSAREVLDEAALDGRTPPPLILVGSRGVGKTVLLGEVAHMAATNYGWLTAHAEVRPSGSFPAQLTERLDACQQLLDEQPAGHRFEVSELTARFGAFGARVEGSLRRRRSPRPSGLPLEEAMVGAMDAAVAKDSGLVVTVDEAQLARRADLAEFAAVLQQHVPDNWPLVVVLAGLASLRNRDRAVTYLERGVWHELGLLDREATLLALTGPAEEAGRRLSQRAAELLASASGGYPYAVQLLGHHAWRASAGTKTINVAHAKAAIPTAEVALQSGLYAARWVDASPREQEYLRAVATLISRTGTATGSEAARAMDARTTEVAYLRDRLLRKGTLVSVGRHLGFPVPGMANWVLTQE